eukprot:3902064-Amphidinium_carterae.1
MERGSMSNMGWIGLWSSNLLALAEAICCSLLRGLLAMSVWMKAGASQSKARTSQERAPKVLQEVTSVRTCVTCQVLACENSTPGKSPKKRIEIHKPIKTPK